MIHKVNRIMVIPTTAVMIMLTALARTFTRGAHLE